MPRWCVVVSGVNHRSLGSAAVADHKVKARLQLYTPRSGCSAKCCQQTDGRHDNSLICARCAPEPHRETSCCDHVQHQHGAAGHHHSLAQQVSQLAGSITATSLLLASGGAQASEDLQAAAAAAQARVQSGDYVPSPIEPGWEVWVGFIAGVIPFAIGSYEFGKRILIQRNCKLCGGRGLVPSTNAGAKYMRKCPECGGFFPWVSWKLFLTSTAAPGNGGPLQQPRGQDSVFYRVPDAPTKEEIQEARAKYMSQGNTTSSSNSDAKGPSADTAKVSASSTDKGQDQ